MEVGLCAFIVKTHPSGGARRRFDSHSPDPVMVGLADPRTYCPRRGITGGLVVYCKNRAAMRESSALRATARILSGVYAVWNFPVCCDMTINAFSR